MSDSGFYVCVTDVKKVVEELAQDKIIDQPLAEILKARILNTQQYLEVK